MELGLMTWPEVEGRLTAGVCVMLPIGSTEQHGPMGLIGTDTICANRVSVAAAQICDCVVAPPIAYTPAPFNTGFPGTVSISSELLEQTVLQVSQGLLAQGFLGVFIVSGHGANLAPARSAASALPEGSVHIQSWWDPEPVARMREEFFGDWEGMHATPSEVAITQTLHGCKPVGVAANPPKKLSRAYIAAHSADRHGPPDEHRQQFPDGRVGSHSNLATPELGRKLLTVASTALASDFEAFSAGRQKAL